MGYRFTPAADQDIIDIYLQSEGRFGASQADRYLSGLHDTLAFLAEAPRSMRERLEFDPAVRIHRYKAHVIIYVTEKDSILIVRLRHGREDWATSPLGD